MRAFTLPKEGQRFSATWDVTVDVPIDGGKIEKQALKPRYQMMEQEDIDEIFDDACERLAKTAGESPDAYRRFGPLGVFNLDPVAAHEFLAMAILDIDGLKQVDEDDKPAPLVYTKTVLTQLIKLTFVRRALLQGYFEFHAGAREKNSGTSSG